MRLTSLLVTVALCSSLAACGGGMTDASTTPRPSSTAPSPSSVAAATPLDGVWSAKHTKQDVVQGLQRGGFGNIVDKFLRSEQIWAKDWWEWTFADRRYTARWLTPSEAWKSADFGTFEVTGDRVALTSSDSGHTTTYRWSISGDRLHLDYLGVSSPLYKGIPEEAYSRAYLTLPLIRVS